MSHVLKFLALEWTTDIVHVLAQAQMLRFGELRRSLPGAISARVLSLRLKQMQAWGLVDRDDRGEKPQHVACGLTNSGRELHRALEEMEKICALLSLPLQAGGEQGSLNRASIPPPA
jgi:DNA-binding HxlR family transcriptional regulator